MFKYIKKESGPANIDWAAHTPLGYENCRVRLWAEPVGRRTYPSRPSPWPAVPWPCASGSL